MEQTAHHYELRWTIKNAKNRLIGRKTLHSGSQEVTDPMPRKDRYKFTVSMKLKLDMKRNDHHRLYAEISEFRTNANFDTRVLLKSFIETVALHSCESDDGFYEINRPSKVAWEPSKGIIVNGTLTILLAMIIKVGGWTMRLADPADQPTESALARAFNDEFCDVVLRSADGRQFPAHKVILAAHSPVFRAMLKSGLKETTESQVKIADCSAEVVEQMLSFIYTGATPEVGDDNLFDVLKAADKYDIKDLLAVCENKIAQSTDSNNAAEVLMLADMFGAKKLKKSAMDWIIRHTSDVMKRPSWKALSETQPRLVDEILLTVVQRK